MKFSIRKNKWDNWNGYISGKKAISFADTPSSTAEQKAKKWLKERNKAKAELKKILLKALKNVTKRLKDLDK